MKTLYRSMITVLILTLFCWAKGAKNAGAGTTGGMLPGEGSCSMEITITHEDASGLVYVLDCMRNGSNRQRVVFTSPQFIYGDLAVRSDAVVYFKYAKWHRPELMGIEAGFAESPFSWDDILNGAAGIHDSLMKADIVDSGTIRIKTLTPRSGVAAKVILREQIPSSELLEKQYLSPSGDILKTITPGNRVYVNGAIRSLTMTIRNRVMNATATVRISAIAAGTQPDHLFDPASTGYVRRAPVIPSETTTVPKE